MKRSEITIQKSDRQIPVALSFILRKMKLPLRKFPCLNIVSNASIIGRELIPISDMNACAILVIKIFIVQFENCQRECVFVISTLETTIINSSQSRGI